MHWLIKYHDYLSFIIIIICIIMKKSSQVEKPTHSVLTIKITLNTCFLPPQFCPPVDLLVFISTPESSWCFGKFYVQFWPIQFNSSILCSVKFTYDRYSVLDMNTFKMLSYFEYFASLKGSLESFIGSFAFYVGD